MKTRYGSKVRIICTDLSFCGPQGTCSSRTLCMLEINDLESITTHGSLAIMLCHHLWCAGIIELD